MPRPLKQLVRCAPSNYSKSTIIQNMHPLLLNDNLVPMYSIVLKMGCRKYVLLMPYPFF